MRPATCLLPIVAALLLTVNAAALAQESFTPITGWDNQIFPSFLVATGTLRLPEEEEINDDSAEVQVLGDRQGALGVEIVAPADETPVTVTIAANAILEESTFIGTLDAESEDLEVEDEE